MACLRTLVGIILLNSSSLLTSFPSGLFSLSFISHSLLVPGELLKLLDVSTSEDVLPTAYGRLQPPLGKHRLKVAIFL